MNKYQEALDDLMYSETIFTYEYGEDETGYTTGLLKDSVWLKEDFETLQELIDNHSKLEKVLDLALMNLIPNRFSSEQEKWWNDLGFYGLDVLHMTSEQTKNMLRDYLLSEVSK